MTLKLYIHPKTTLFTARVNEPSAVTYPRDYVDFDSVGVGTYSLIGLNMTVLIGSSAGAHDLGITRTRLFPTSSRLYIGRSSKGDRVGEVTLTDNAYITVLYSPPRVWSKVPYIDPSGVTYYDSSLDYATYGANRPPVANAGPAVIGEVDSGSGKLAINFTAANSFVTMAGASIASYAWSLGLGASVGSFTGGTSLSDQDIETEFDPGFYLISLLVADDNAAQHTAYVPVIAIDPDDDPCLYNFEIESHRITPQGQELQVRILDDIDEATYLDGAWCALIDGDPGDADDRTNIIFQGWIEISDEEIRATATGLLRDTSLTMLDVAGRLKALPGYSTVIEHAASPANWQEFNTPTMLIMLHTLLQYQSTALDVADFVFYGDEDDYTFKILASDGDSIFDQVDRRAGALIPDHLFVCNRRGQLSIKVDQMLLDSGDRTSTSQGTFTSAYYSELRYRQQRNPRVNWLRSNAILTGTTEVATAFCIAPGDAPGQGVQQADDGEHLALSQSDLNAVTGHRYARANAPQGPFTMVLAEGTDFDLEPAALTWIKLTIDSAVAAQRGLTFSEARFLMRQLDIRYNHAETGLTKTVTVVAERETEGLAATTVTVEEAGEVDDGGWVPPVGGPAPDYFSGSPDGGGTVAAIDTYGYIYTTSNFTAGTPTWSRNIAAATAASIGAEDLLSWVVDPFSPGYRGTPGGAINGWVAHEDGIYRVTDIFGTPAYTLQASLAPATNRTAGRWSVIAASFGRFFAAESDNPWLLCVRSHRNVSGGSKNGVYVTYSVDAGQTWSSETAINTNYDNEIANSPRRIAGVWMSPRTPGYALVGVYTTTGDPADTDIYKTTDWGASWASAGIASDLDDGLGYCFHVPFNDNADESLLYYTKLTKSSVLTYATRRTDGSTDADVTPVDSGLHYAPFRSLFGIQSLDTNRLHMVMAGQANEADGIDLSNGSSGAKAAIFTSSDGGANWTLRHGPITGDLNDDWPSGVAFAAGDSDIIYAWGNNGMMLYSADNGANWADKKPTGTGFTATVEMLGIAGGATS